MCSSDLESNKRDCWICGARMRSHTMTGLTGFSNSELLGYRARKSRLDAKWLPSGGAWTKFGDQFLGKLQDTRRSLGSGGLTFLA